MQTDPSRALYSHGCSPRFRLQGDFEITVSFKILELGKPTSGYGNGISLRMLTEYPKGNGATVARFHHPVNGHAFVTDAARSVKGKRSHETEYFPTVAETGS